MKSFRKILLLMMSLLLTITISACDRETMNIKTESITLEYGETVSQDIYTYIENSDEYISEVVLSDIPVNEKDKEYPSIGEYEIKLVHNKEEGIVKVIVQDTVKPEFTKIKDKYEVEHNKRFNKNLIKAKDLSNVKIVVEDEKVDYKKAGDYKVNVKAEDEHGNIAEKEIVITVKEEKKEQVVINTNTNQSSSKKPAGNKTQSSSSNKNSKNENATNNQNSSNNNDKNGDGRPDEYTIYVPEVDMTTHVHEGPAVENMYFDTWDELDEWASAYQDYKLFEEGVDIGAAYGGSECSCGKKYIHRFY